MKPQNLNGTFLVAAFAVLALGAAAQASVFNMGGTRNPDGTWTGLASLETVPVGNVGNTGEWSGASYGGWGPDRICGAVDYAYNIGKYEVTAGQYCEFLNAVATTSETFGLYNELMGSNEPREFGCKIERTFSSGGYKYSVAPDWANRPVNHVSWGDAARFANWLHNGEPTGVQNVSTTEDGAYYINGATSDLTLMTIGREIDWRWAIPTEDEWYKAAYHKNDGDTGNYFDYPTGSDSEPSNDLLDPDPGNNANYYLDNIYTIGAPYWATFVGDFEKSESPYGTFDQGGNPWEWTEAVFSTPVPSRGLRGGGWGEYLSDTLAASFRGSNWLPTTELGIFGFRMVSLLVPGDANDDGFVDDADASILGANWFNTNAHWGDGDFNNDHVVNDQDAAILAAHWHQSIEQTASVPEPTALASILSFLATAALRFLWHRRHPG